MPTTSLKLAMGLLLLLALAGCGTQLSGIDRDGTLVAQLSSVPVVNSLSDDGDGVCDATECTLREAIAAAAAGATIKFDANLTGTITLKVAEELVIDKDLVIEGPGASNLSIDGGYSLGRYGRVFRIEPGATVSISGLTITGGSPRDVGGGILNAGRLFLTDCAVSGNRGYAGGGIINREGDVTLTNTTVSENDLITYHCLPEEEYACGPYGGGILSILGTLTLIDTTVSGNGAWHGEEIWSVGHGGGIVSFGSEVKVTGSTISDNEAANGGGILLMYNTTATITESTVSGNSASVSGGVGNWDSALTLVRSTVSANRSTWWGGGVFSWTNPDDAGQQTTILNSTVSGNTAGIPGEEFESFGGGITNAGGLTRILFSTVTGNQAATFGGGVYTGGSFEGKSATTKVEGSLIWGNTLSDGTTPDDVAAGSTVARYDSLGFNLVGTAGVNVDFTSVFNLTGDQSAEPFGTWLGALQDNRGPTHTHALLAGSPAIEAGTCTGRDGDTVTSDQRGVPRPQGTRCDVGAFEYEFGSIVFTGFASPVNDAPTLNIAKAGQTIPLKWHLADASGHPITDLESVSVTVTSLACPAGTTTDAIEEYTRGTSGLQNLGDGYYQYNWATPKGYARSCKTMSLDLGDGIAHTALFQFTR
jgi:CSLREA domain-containing protein